MSTTRFNILQNVGQAMTLLPFPFPLFRHAAIGNSRSRCRFYKKKYFANSNFNPFTLWTMKRTPESCYPNTMANVVASDCGRCNAGTIEQRVTLLFRLFVRHGSCPFGGSHWRSFLESKFVKPCQNDDLAPASEGRGAATTPSAPSFVSFPFL